MVKQYVLTLDDFRILQRRIKNPCSSCKDGPKPGDYGYLGCGQEGNCRFKKKYDDLMSRAKEADLVDLYHLLIQVDALLAQKKEVVKQLNELAAKIGDEYGTKVLVDISRNLYSGEF